MPLINICAKKNGYQHPVDNKKALVETRALTLNPQGKGGYTGFHTGRPIS